MRAEDTAGRHPGYAGVVFRSAQALFLVVASVATPSVAAGGGDRVAVLPLSATGVALDEVPELERLDSALRRAVSQLPDVRLQPKPDTLAHVAGARDVGLSCTPSDVACLGKLAVLAEVDVVLSPAATLTSGTFEIALTLVERGGATRSSRASLPRPRDELEGATAAAIAQLWGAASSAPTAATAEPAPAVAAAPAPVAAPAPSDPSPPGPAAEAPVDASESDDDGTLLWAGVGIATGAVALLALAGGGVAAAFVLLGPPPPSGPAVVVLE
jgi:hypothetical protein